jgi:hypothetical protein
MIALALAVAATPASAFAPGTYQIRNASGTPMLCALLVSRGGAYYRVTLRPGQAFRQTLETDGARELACSTNRYSRTAFRVRAGLIYELIETRSGEIRLRTVGASAT